MGVSAARFNTQDQPVFVRELRKRVNEYFKDNNISRHANWNMKLKTLFMISLYFVPFILMLTGVLSNFWLVMAAWTLMGFGMAGIGLSIMHDANHGSYSKNKNTNFVLGYIVNFLGAYHINWQIQHNVLHHSYTNIEGLDEDIETPLMRFSPGQKKVWIFRLQAFYAPFLYGLLTINWLFSKDFSQLKDYNQRGLLKAQGTTFTKALFELIINKIWYIGLTLVLPIVLIDLPWYQVLIGFFFMHFLCGVILSFIFQLAHVIEETDFFIPNDDGNLENNWAIHQLKTTANFANRNDVLSWFIGGLNYQVEHHLFPNICHIHYKKIAEIVKATTKEFGVPYNEHKSFASALKSHFKLIHELGTGKYDERIQKKNEDKDNIESTNKNESLKKEAQLVEA